MSESGKGPSERSYILDSVKRTHSPTNVVQTQQNDGGRHSSNPSASGQTQAAAPEGPTTVVATSPVATDDMANLMNINGDNEHFNTKNSSLSQASFNYINSIIGSGVIGMSYAMHQSGIGVGLILMIIVAYITDYSLILMVRGGQLSGSFSYQGMMEAAFGKVGFYILSLLQFIYPIIAMVSYNTIVGDTMTKVLTYFTNTSPANAITLQRELVVFIATIFITLPLSLLRNVAKMAKISFLSLISLGFIMVSIMIRLVVFSDNIEIPPSPDAWQFANTGVIQAISIMAFAFMTHHNTFLIYGSMREKSEEKWSQVTHISIGTSLAISLIFAIGGYATFTGYVQGDLLENYCWSDSLINISRLLFCLTILLTFPLECLVAREVVETICFQNKERSSTSRHFSVTLFIVTSAFIISMSTDCLGVTLQLNGILAAVPMAYILPALCYIRLEPTRFFSRVKLPAICTALFGIIVSVSGLIILIWNGNSTSNCTHGAAMWYCTLHPKLVLKNGSIIDYPSNFTDSHLISSPLIQHSPVNMFHEILPDPLH